MRSRTAETQCREFTVLVMESMAELRVDRGALEECDSDS